MTNILPVRLFTDKVLYQSCLPITDFTGLDKIAEQMIETMFSNRGVGLAAPQIGLSLNFAVMHLENKTKILAVANIIIKSYTKEMDIQNEGCLSAPGILIPVKRHLGVEIEAQNLLGEKVEYRFTDYDARILQHEFDHLNGKLITNNLMKL